VLFVRQWRTPAERILLEIPAGTLDVVDAATGAIEDPDLAARRELEEETGYRAGTWEKLTEFWTAPGFASELMHLYLATELTPAHPDERLGPDEDEHLRLERRSLPGALAAIDSGEIADAKSIVGLLWLDRRLRDAASTEGLAAAPAATPAGQEASAPAPDPTTIERTYRMTRGELARASVELAQRSRFLLVSGIVLLALGMYPLVNGDIWAGTPALVIGLAMLTGLISLPFTLFAAWRYRERVLPEITITIDATGIRYRSATASSINAWESFARIRETGRFLWFELPPQTSVVPNRIFSSDELAEIRRSTAAHGFGMDGRPVRRSAGRSSGRGSDIGR
jgi:8-oxo-dGTP pyrophosphatase MutT (NUDIX family)